MLEISSQHQDPTGLKISALLSYGKEYILGMVRMVLISYLRIRMITLTGSLATVRKKRAMAGP